MGLSPSCVGFAVMGVGPVCVVCTGASCAFLADQLEMLSAHLPMNRVLRCPALDAGVELRQSFMSHCRPSLMWIPLTMDVHPVACGETIISIVFSSYLGFSRIRGHMWTA